MMLTVTIMATLPAQFVQPVLSTLTEKLSDAVEVEKVGKSKVVMLLTLVFFILILCYF